MKLGHVTGLSPLTIRGASDDASTRLRPWRVSPPGSVFVLGEPVAYEVVGGRHLIVLRLGPA